MLITIIFLFSVAAGAGYLMEKVKLPALLGYMLVGLVFSPYMSANLEVEGFLSSLFLSHKDYAEGIEGFETLPDVEAERDTLSILNWDLEPGDCIVFHMRTLHGAPATSELKTRRRGFSTRWLGDDAYFAKRAWKTSPPFPEVQLEHGAPMRHELFPVVWQA